MSPMTKMWQQSLLFLHFHFLLVFLRTATYTRAKVINNDINIDEQGTRATSIQNFANPFKCLTRQ